MWFSKVTGGIRCHTCMPGDPASLSLFYIPPSFIQLTHEELLHKSKKTVAPLAGKPILHSGHLSTEPSSCNKIKRKIRTCCRSDEAKIFPRYFWSLVLFSFAVVLENWHLLTAFVEGFLFPPNISPVPSSPPIPCLLFPH